MSEDTTRAVSAVAAERTPATEKQKTNPVLKAVPRPEEDPDDAPPVAIRTGKRGTGGARLDFQKIALGVATVLGTLGGGAYVASPWASSGDLKAIETKLEAEVTAREETDKAIAKQLKTIAEHLGVEVEPDIKRVIKGKPVEALTED